MDGERCPSCGHYTILEDYDERVCLDCGFVIEQNVIQPHVELQPSGQPIGVQLSHFETDKGIQRPSFQKSHDGNAGKIQMFQNCRRIAALLRFSRNEEEQIIAKMQQLMGNQYKTGRKSELMVAACAYIICRQSNKPISLVEVADVVQHNVFHLGRIYRDVLEKLNLSLRELDPALFIHRTISTLDEHFPREKKQNIIKQTVRMVELAKEDWLTTGRKPESITASALFLAAQANGVNIPRKIIARSLFTSQYTLKSRETELRARLVEANKKIPIPREVNQRNLIHHIPFILDQIFFLSKENLSKSETLTKHPPSYAKGVKSRNQRTVKLENVKKRLIRKAGLTENLKEDPQQWKKAVTLLNQRKQKYKEEIDQVGGKEEAFDPDELMMEKKLLEGVDEEFLLTGYYDSLSMTTLESNIPREISTDLNEEDIPEKDLHLYIKSADEVDKLEQLERTKRRKV